MTRDRHHPLHPFPDGWYVIEESARLGVEQLIQKMWMGEEIVVWRDRKGAVCVADAFCPHLGAHLGPAAGGKVCEGNLVCPFHGFAYDTTGQCVATPHAPPPRAARLKSYAVQEVNGFILAYWDHRGHAPTWWIPDFSPDGWPGRAVTRRTLCSHPQATTENSVDFGHLSHVHGYRDLKQVAPTAIEGPCLQSYYAFRRQMLTPGLRRLGFPVNIRISVWGLGVSVVEIRGPMDLNALQWVMATPIDGERIDLWLGIDLKGRLRLPRLGLLPSWISHKLVSRILLRELVLDVMKDAAIWQYQRFRAKPIFGQGDGDVARFRRYCIQFYPPMEAAAPHPAAGASPNG